jgi:hypothetical protein
MAAETAAAETAATRPAATRTAGTPAAAEVPPHEHVGMAGTTGTTGTTGRAMDDTRVEQPVYPEEPGAAPVEERMRTERR